MSVFAWIGVVICSFAALALFAGGVVGIISEIEAARDKTWRRGWQAGRVEIGRNLSEQIDVIDAPDLVKRAVREISLRLAIGGECNVAELFKELDFCSLDVVTPAGEFELSFPPKERRAPDEDL